MSERWSVIIVGAGPAGLGCARALQSAGVDRVLVLERSCVASSFQDWPAEMRFITPSFNANSFDLPDLNSVCPNTSPADMWGVQTLSGRQYALYLMAFRRHFQLEVAEGVSVEEVRPTLDGFEVVASERVYESNFVIWAAGEFSLPRVPDIPGAELGVHTSLVRSWQTLPGRDFTVVGGYESGIDAAYHLIKKGGRVRVLAAGEPWSCESSDPSEALSPSTKERLRCLEQDHQDRLTLVADSRVHEIGRRGRRFQLKTAKGDFETPNRPLLATGFSSAVTPIKELFEWSDSTPVFSQTDESTLHPGLFYSGPSLVHEGAKFCFIYKFRARFGVIAKTIAARLDHPDEFDGLEVYARRSFLIEDLSCCLDCRCEIDSEDE